MSEYQYYEFQAIDRPLSEKEMRELRSYSTRARITPTSFVNEYNWGNFKGDPDAWMENYFDAFLYLANRGTHILKLRLPSRLVDPKTVQEYCAGESFFVREKADKVILSFESEDEYESDWVEGEGILSALIPVRAEVARGDLRALYLGWLLCAQNGELDEEEIEPPVPSGLGQLSVSLESLVEFLRIDRDLLEVAAQVSVPLEGIELDREEVSKWVSRLPDQEKNEHLARLIVNGDSSIGAMLIQRFIKERFAASGLEEPPRRKVGELFQSAETNARERERIEAEQRAREKMRREQEAAKKREKYLDGLAGKETKKWAEVEQLISTKQPRCYDLAVNLIIDLRDLALRAKGAEFHRSLEALRQAHARKPSFLERLKKAGL